jgi:hypothetical protein
MNRTQMFYPVTEGMIITPRRQANLKHELDEPWWFEPKSRGELRRECRSIWPSENGPISEKRIALEQGSMILKIYFD